MLAKLAKRLWVEGEAVTCLVVGHGVNLRHGGQLDLIEPTVQQGSSSKAKLNKEVWRRGLLEEAEEAEEEVVVVVVASLVIDR